MAEQTNKWPLFAEKMANSQLLFVVLQKHMNIVIIVLSYQIFFVYREDEVWC